MLLVLFVLFVHLLKLMLVADAAGSRTLPQPNSSLSILFAFPRRVDIIAMIQSDTTL